MLVTSICPAPSLPLQAPFTFSSGNVHSSIVITIIRPDQTSARYFLPQFLPQSHEWGVQNGGLYREWCAMTCISDRGTMLTPGAK